MDFEFTPKLGAIMIVFGLLTFIPWIYLTIKEKFNDKNDK